MVGQVLIIVDSEAVKKLSFNNCCTNKKNENKPQKILCVISGITIMESISFIFELFRVASQPTWYILTWQILRWEDKLDKQLNEMPLLIEMLNYKEPEVN